LRAEIDLLHQHAGAVRDVERHVRLVCGTATAPLTAAPLVASVAVELATSA
jgi:hypothetical protein